MEKLFLLLFASVLCVAAYSQTLTMSQVPPAAANGFKQKFPNGSQPGWAKAGEYYQVGFFNGKKRQTAMFDESGKWLKAETEINYGAVPGKVQRAFEKEFEGYQIQEVFEVETPDDAVQYEFIAFSARDNYAALFSAKGELIKKEKGSSE